MAVGLVGIRKGRILGRTSKALLAAGVAALSLGVAPAASAAEVAVPDAAGCTTVLVNEAGGWVPLAMPFPVDIEYTPPATVYVSADRGIAFALGVVNNISGDVVAFVDCVV